MERRRRRRRRSEIRGQAAARGYGFIQVEGHEDVFVLSSEVTDEHGGPATRGEWSALDGRTVEIGDVITTERGDQATNVRLLPVENASTDGAEASTADGDAGAGGCGERGAMVGRDPRAP